MRVQAVVGWLYEGARYSRRARFGNGNMRLLAVGLDTGRGVRFVTGNMRLLAVILDTGGVLVL
jgi:hypothetical protein